VGEVPRGPTLLGRKRQQISRGGALAAAGLDEPREGGEVMPRVHVVAILGLLVCATGCYDRDAWEEDLESPADVSHAYGWSPRPPEEASNEQAFVRVNAPAAQDNFWLIAEPLIEEPPPPRPRSISLGYIGDEPLGRTR
jgi:hypothetical protein